MSHSIRSNLGARAAGRLNPATLIHDQENTAVTATRRKSRPLEPAQPIDPRVKAWIDNVIVPALLDRWDQRQRMEAAA